MALILRGDTWYVELGGKRESTGTSDRAAAERYQERLKLLGRRERKDPVVRGRTWDQAAAQWLKETAHKRDHRSDVSKIQWLNAHFSGRLLKALTRDLVMDVLDKKRAATSASTANRYLALVRAILRRARDEWEWIDKIPKLRQWEEPPGRDRWLKSDEIERLLAQLPEHQRRMCAFAFAVGQRQAAIKRLKWEHVNLDKRFAWIIRDNSKSKKPIPVPLNDTAMEILTACTGDHAEYVFVFNGKPVTQVNTRAWHKALKRAGITDFRWHDTRHTWASHHSMNGTPDAVLMELGGWSSHKMVAKYRHLSNEHLEKFADNAAPR